jgi:tetratricopeptide (TPR) repeat protein
MFVSGSTKVLLKINTNDLDIKQIVTDIKSNLFLLYFKIGKSFYNKGELKTTLKFLKKSIEASQDFKEAYHNLGVVYYELGNFDKALVEFKKAIEIDDRYAKAHYSLALLYYRIGDFDNAIKHLLKLTQLQPNNANAHFDLAVSYVDRFREKELKGSINSDDLTDLEKALYHYLKTEELKPGFPNALNNADIIKKVIEIYD